MQKGSKINSPEDLINLGKEIKKLMQKKKQADEHLIELETRIYNLETEYLKETGTYGSIMSGLEGYLGLAGAQAAGGGMRRSVYKDVKDSARIFSNTSASSRRSVSMYNRYLSGSSATAHKGSAYNDEDYSDEGDDLGEDDEIMESTSNKRARTAPKASSSQRRRK